MTDIIIPIKQLPLAKQRLATVLTPAQRAGLVLAMLEDLLAALADTQNNQVHIVSSDPEVFALANRFGARSVPEEAPHGYNEAIDLALTAIDSQRNIAILPGDLPLATSAEIAVLIAPSQTGEECIRLAPSRDRLGTNGLFVSSARQMRPQFGPGSFELHRRGALELGVEASIIEAPRLAHDIDTPADLQDLLDANPRGATAKFLEPINGHSKASTCYKWVAA